MHKYYMAGLKMVTFSSGSEVNSVKPQELHSFPIVVKNKWSVSTACMCVNLQVTMAAILTETSCYVNLAIMTSTEKRPQHHRGMTDYRLEASDRWRMTWSVFFFDNRSCTRGKWNKPRSPDIENNEEIHSYLLLSMHQSSLLVLCSKCAYYLTIIAFTRHLFQWLWLFINGSTCTEWWIQFRQTR